MCQQVQLRVRWFEPGPAVEAGAVFVGACEVVYANETQRRFVLAHIQQRRVLRLQRQRIGGQDDAIRVVMVFGCSRSEIVAVVDRVDMLIMSVAIEPNEMRLAATIAREHKQAFVSGNGPETSGAQQQYT